MKNRKLAKWIMRSISIGTIAALGLIVLLDKLSDAIKNYETMIS